MNYRILSLALICFLSIFTFSCGPLIKENYSLYDNNTEKISIQYPSNWEKREHQDGYEYVIFMVLSPLEGIEDNFRENVNIVTEKAPGYTIDTYTETNISSMYNGLNNFKVLSKGTRKINNNTSKWIIYNHSYNELILKVKVYFFYYGNNGLVFTATATPETFEKYEPVFDEIVSTLKLK